MKTLQVLAGVLAAAVFGLLVCVAYALLGRFLQEPPRPDLLRNILLISVWPNLLLVPLGMGIVAAYCWRKLGIGIGAYLLLSLLITCVALSGAWLVFKEGTICLVIVSPVLLLCIFAGTVVGREWFKGGDGTLRISIIPLLFLAVLGDAKMRADRVDSVTDAILVRARPERVWSHVVAFPEINSPPGYWLFRIGLPSPCSTTCEGAFVGADRRCIFSNGLAFKETISELTPNQLLTFDIVEQPRDPELLGHLTLRRGQFMLRDNGDGTVTLIGTSWYALHVRPLWYFNWWTRDITRHVHLRVMNHIKELAENGSVE